MATLWNTRERESDLNLVSIVALQCVCRYAVVCNARMLPACLPTHSTGLWISLQRSLDLRQLANPNPNPNL